MAGRVLTLGVLLMLVALGGGPTALQARGPIEERVVLSNDSVRIVLATYPPGADSDLHLNIGAEITLVQEGELALYTPGGREVLGAGAAHWLPDGTTHLARNEGQRPARFWSLVLKRRD